jgi:hypothetical protein
MSEAARSPTKTFWCAVSRFDEFRPSWSHRRDSATLDPTSGGEVTDMKVSDRDTDDMTQNVVANPDELSRPSGAHSQNG